MTVPSVNVQVPRISNDAQMATCAEIDGAAVDGCAPEDEGLGLGLARHNSIGACSQGESTQDLSTDLSDGRGCYLWKNPSSKSVEKQAKRSQKTAEMSHASKRISKGTKRRGRPPLSKSRPKAQTAVKCSRNSRYNN